MASIAAAASSLMNGERAVVLLFVLRVLSSLPPCLLSHGLALCSLAAAAFHVEIRLENSSSLLRFKTRPGASSGILLAAVTLPTVLISKLIQLSRAVSPHQVSYEDFEYLKMLYWAASVSSFGVLVFLYSALQHSPDKAYPPSSNIQSTSWLMSCCIGLYAALCCVSLAIMSNFGLQLAFNLFWVVCHGFAAVKLIQHLLNTFPSCASVGEALLLSAGIVLYSGDMLACTFTKINERFVSFNLVSPWYSTNRSERSIIIQSVLLALLVFPLIFKLLLRLWECPSTMTSDARTLSEVRRSLLFFGSLACMLIVIAPSWMQFAQDFQSHPFLWVFSFVFGEPVKRLSLCVYWVCLIYASVIKFYNISKNSKVERILLRKYYHLMAVSMFSPALILQPEFLDLAFGAALAVFLVIEIIRVWRIWPLGKLVHQFMNAFTDHRDSDLLIVSHFSLLLGCALPMWLSFGYNDRPLAPFAGILSLGIGDTMASLVGHKYGVLRWSKTGKKTIEGTAAGITSVLVACSALLPLLASTGYVMTQHWFSLLLAVTASGLLEAYTAQLDNAFIPLVFYSLLCL
ncbi:dolichol kinase EVAN [Eucalyptus grandis]|uniref:dolichol kinase EVAN n=1 Tax=Eucalyptus grandis TaxID=71139 RepID=UPI00192EF294|nr:dolichol kinase EVAN [Eucalyptus grandis]